MPEINDTIRPRTLYSGNSHFELTPHNDALETAPLAFERFQNRKNDYKKFNTHGMERYGPNRFSKSRKEL
jgi:hypothetical protein